jgi:hypothetical protein
MNKKNALAVTVAFVIGFFLSVSAGSLGVREAGANRDSECSSASGTICDTDNDCCGSLTCSGTKVTKEGETYSTCK